LAEPDGAHALTAFRYTSTNFTPFLPIARQLASFFDNSSFEFFNNISENYPFFFTSMDEKL